MNVTKDRWPRHSHIQSLGAYICAKHTTELCGEEKKTKAWAIPSRKLMPTCEKGEKIFTQQVFNVIKFCQNFRKILDTTDHSTLRIVT